MFSGLLLASMALATTVLGHMQLNYPPTFNSSNNPHTSGEPDQFLFYPYNCCGRTTPFPCRGYLSLLDKPEGASVASWAAGSTQEFSLTGIGNHYGGSCQVGFSIDRGATFKVATSFEGDCPHRNGGVDPAQQTFAFTVPSELPAGDVVFAWSWTNREREFFMNCAAVTITKPGSYSSPSGGSNSKPAPSAPSAPSYVPTTDISTTPNAANSYDMAGCSCTCVDAAKLDKDNQYAMGGCTCTCPTSPGPMKPGAIAKRDGAGDGKSGPVTYQVGDWDCTCASKDGDDDGSGSSGFRLNDCECVTARAPSLAGVKEEVKRSAAYPRRALTSDERDAIHAHKRSVAAFNKRPEMFFGDIGDGCLSPHTTAELKYPHPGPDVVPGDGVYPLELPTGTC